MGAETEPAPPVIEDPFGSNVDLSNAQADYGTELLKQPSPPPTQKRLNPIAVAVGFIVPWIMFVVIFADVSFYVHYFYPGACVFVIIIGAAITLFFGVLFFLARNRGKSDPFWFAFFFSTLLVALVLGAVLGDINYEYHTKPYNTAMSMNSYSNIDPSVTHSQELMDGSRIRFKDDVTIDSSKSMSFQDTTRYCVAPIGQPRMDAGMPVYDVWAVGIDCCTRGRGDFHCGAYNERTAHSGLRLMEESDESFYRLAVKQAEATYQVSSPNPIFVHWVLDAKMELNKLATSGMNYYLLGIFVYLAVQCILVCLIAMRSLLRREPTEQKLLAAPYVPTGP